jgi:hypothetical protein
VPARFQHGKLLLPAFDAKTCDSHDKPPFDIMTLVLALLIGVLAGLRSLTPAAVIAWAARLGWLKLPHTLSWIGTAPAVALFSVLAIVELVTDKLPITPCRTAPPGLDCAMPDADRGSMRFLRRDSIRQ